MAKTTDKIKRVVPATKKAEPVSIGTIAESINMDPKVARAKLRRLGKDVPATVGDTWSWTPANVAKVKAMLKTDNRRNDE